MRVMTWNIHGANENSGVWGFLLDSQPDIVLLQEVGGIPEEIYKFFNVLLKTAITKTGKAQRFSTAVMVKGKIINEINVYGMDFVSALRNVASNSPSLRLTELLNGIATTINSGGSLPDFFEKRSQSLLFEYRIEREKNTKSAETFMDIYISVVIAAPMILMLLLIMMRVSGLGVSMSTSMITLMMVMGVTTVNILFLTFLQLKQPQT